MLCFFSSRRRHTRYWRDWSSDVCSSDLQVRFTTQFGMDECGSTPPKPPGMLVGLGDRIHEGCIVVVSRCRDQTPKTVDCGGQALGLLVWLDCTYCYASICHLSTRVLRVTLLG